MRISKKAWVVARCIYGVMLLKTDHRPDDRLDVMRKQNLDHIFSITYDYCVGSSVNVFEKTRGQRYFYRWKQRELRRQSVKSLHFSCFVKLHIEIVMLILDAINDYFRVSYNSKIIRNKKI